MKSASLDVTALQEALGDEGTIIDLSGCTLDSVLYEVSAQRPVIAGLFKQLRTVIHTVRISFPFLRIVQICVIFIISNDHNTGTVWN